MNFLFNFVHCTSSLCSLIILLTDLQMVNIGLRVLARPQATMLPDMYRKLGLDFDERVLPSIMNEVHVQDQRRYFEMTFFLLFTQSCVCYLKCAQLGSLHHVLFSLILLLSTQLYKWVSVNYTVNAGRSTAL